MSREKQIEEMADIIYSKINGANFDDVSDAVVAIYDAGYRKQIEGEWICGCICEEGEHLHQKSCNLVNEGEKTMDETKMTACSCKPYNELEATVELMLSEDYKARFVAEYRQTKIRYERLKKFCNRIEAAMTYPGKVDMPKHDCDLSLLREQQNWMEHYLHALEVRAVVEHIEL